MANRYLQDNFAPVHDELTATDLEVTGELPRHLDGRYLRIGPNPATDPGQRYHWFLGEGMVHGVRLADGQAQWYRNRWVRPQPGDFAPNTNVLEHAGRTLALVEAGSPPYELSHDLETVGRCDFGGTRTGGYTAHPHEDPDTGELHAVSYDWTRGNRLDYTVLDAAGRIRQVRGDPGARQPDGARLRADRALRRGLRPAGHLRHRDGHPRPVGVRPDQGARGAARW